MFRCLHKLHTEEDNFTLDFWESEQITEIVQQKNRWTQGVYDPTGIFSFIVHLQ